MGPTSIGPRAPGAAAPVSLRGTRALARAAPARTPRPSPPQAEARIDGCAAGISLGGPTRHRAPPLRPGGPRPRAQTGETRSRQADQRAAVAPLAADAHQGLEHGGPLRGRGTTRARRRPASGRQRSSTAWPGRSFERDFFTACRGGEGAGACKRRSWARANGSRSACRSRSSRQRVGEQPTRPPGRFFAQKGLAHKGTGPTATGPRQFEALAFAKAPGPHAESRCFRCGKGRSRAAGDGADSQFVSPAASGFVARRLATPGRPRWIVGGSAARPRARAAPDRGVQPGSPRPKTAHHGRKIAVHRPPAAQTATKPSPIRPAAVFEQSARSARATAHERATQRRHICPGRGRRGGQTLAIRITATPPRSAPRAALARSDFIPARGACHLRGPPLAAGSWRRGSPCLRLVVDASARYTTPRRRSRPADAPVARRRTPCRLDAAPS